MTAFATTALADTARLYAEAAAQAARWGLTPAEWRRSLTAKHIFTHVEWHMTGYVLEVSGAGPEDFFWADGPALDALAVPSAFSRFVREARAALSGQTPSDP